MGEKKDCKVVQDLLPNYIEKLTNPETNKYIETHLKECEECNKIYENMKKEIELNITQRDRREVKYIKKFSNKMKILKIILLVILIVFIGIMGYKFIIIKSMQGKISKYKDITNFHVTMTKYSGDSIVIDNLYHKDGKYAHYVKMIGQYNDEISTKEIISFTNGNTYMAVDDIKIAILGGMPTASSDSVYNFLETGNIGEMIVGLFTTNISSVKCNDKDCYKIDNFKTSELLFPEQGLCVYIDKETGLLVRVEQGDRNNATGGIFTSVTDYQYEFDTVTDEDLKEPDIKEYKIQGEDTTEKADDTEIEDNRNTNLKKDEEER